MVDDSRNVAVLIDFENLNDTKSLKKVLAHGGELGWVVVKRAVGDFSANGDKTQSKLRELGILPVQQATAGKGTNSSDMRMAIEAIDLFHHRDMSIDVFVLASSDADFLPLAQWLRAAGKSVVGAGRSDASEMWQQGVDEFVVVKTVKAVAVTQSSKMVQVPKSSAKTPTPKPKTLSKKHREVVDKVISDIVAEGSKPISNVKFLKRIRGYDENFSSKTHGFSSLRKVVQSIDTLHVPAEPKTGNFMIHIRKQKGKTST